MKRALFSLTIVAFFGWAVLGLVSSCGGASPPLLGTLSNGHYTAPNQRFGLDIPRRLNPFEALKPREWQNPHNPDHFALFLDTPSMGEHYMASASTIPPEALAELNQLTEEERMDRLGRLALRLFYEGYAANPTLVSRIEMRSPLGNGWVMMYQIPQGSRLLASFGGATPQHVDVLVAVGVVLSGQTYKRAAGVFETAQGADDPNSELMGKLQANVGMMVGAMTTP